MAETTRTQRSSLVSLGKFLLDLAMITVLFCMLRDHWSSVLSGIDVRVNRRHGFLPAVSGTRTLRGAVALELADYVNVSAWMVREALEITDGSCLQSIHDASVQSAALYLVDQALGCDELPTLSLQLHSLRRATHALRKHALQDLEPMHTALYCLRDYSIASATEHLQALEWMHLDWTSHLEAYAQELRDAYNAATFVHEAIRHRAYVVRERRSSWWMFERVFSPRVVTEENNPGLLIRNFIEPIPCVEEHLSGLMKLLLRDILLADDRFHRARYAVGNHTRLDDNYGLAQFERALRCLYFPPGCHHG